MEISKSPVVYFLPVNRQLKRWSLAYHTSEREMMYYENNIGSILLFYLLGDTVEACREQDQKI